MFADLEQFSIDCGNSLPKAITAANHSKKNITRSQWEVEVKRSKLSVALENANDQSLLVFVLNLIGWESSATSLDQSLNDYYDDSWITFDTRLEIVVS